MSDSKEPTFTASDVKEASGLTYRQLNEWDRRGALPESRDADAEWRKFSPKAMFVLLVCSELRRRFNVGLESLKWLKDFMMQEGADHFSAAVDLMAHGLNVLLLTNLKDTFEMACDLDISDLFYLGYARHEEPEAFVLLKVNPLVNTLLGAFEEPMELKIDHELYRAFYNVRREMKIQSLEELEVLRLIRGGNFSKVVIKLANGKVIRADAESEHAARTGHELADLLRQELFQTITVTQQSGKIIRVTRKIPNVLTKTRRRRGTPERRVLKTGK